MLIDEASTLELKENTAAPPTFDGLGLRTEVRSALDEMGYQVPTPVQLAVYASAIARKDLVVQAQTGTGKTTAYGLPMMDRLINPTLGPQALILSPTRELSVQIAHELSRLGKLCNIRTVAWYGGTSFDQQADQAVEGVQIISATPGRLLDHLSNHTFDAKQIRFVILDEADEMLSMGFMEQVDAIFQKLPTERTTWLFSATVDDSVERVAAKYLRNPDRIDLSEDAVVARTLSHTIYTISGKGRAADLIRILRVEEPASAIIFCNTKVETERVAVELQKAGLSADWLNGDLSQKERETTLAQTKQGKTRFLVATDVAARGIDISHLTHVINLQLPESLEQYIHRTGRAGRAGKLGHAISLVSPPEIANLYLLKLRYGLVLVERSLPSAQEMRTQQESDRIRVLHKKFPGQPSEEERRLTQRLLTDLDAERLIAGLLREYFRDAPAAKEPASAAPPRRTTTHRPTRRPPKKNQNQP